MSKGKDVRNALTVEIQKVTDIGTTGSRWHHWQKVQRFPAAFTILESDDKERTPFRSKEVTATYRIATIIRGDNPEDEFDDLRDAIETEIEDDPSLGGLALDAWVSGTGDFATTTIIAGQVYVRDIFVTVVYRYSRGSP